MTQKSEVLLKVSNLSTYFFTEEGIVYALDDLSFELNKGATLGIVGESGSGKSVTALSIMRLIQTPPGRIVSGKVELMGEDILKKSHKEMKQIRGCKIGMIFQEPMTSLNPVYTIGNQVMESILLHEKCGKAKAKEKAIDMLRLVGIPLPEKRFSEYPHQLSGGMRQRVMIAIALSCNPQLLICDEPTTALDVTIQAQILALINDLKVKTGAAVMMITHDLGVISKVADEVIVMYAGKAMEYGPVKDVFLNPKHPYTEALLKSIPTIEEDVEKLHVIEGMVPSLSKLPEGCLFHPRCTKAMPECSTKRPALTEDAQGRRVRCFLHSNQEEKEAVHV